MQLLAKEKDDQIAMNKGPKISTKEKRRTEEAKPKGPAVSQRHHCLIWGEYVNVLLDRPQKIFFYFAVFDQFNVLLLIMLLHCHKIGEYLNKDHSFQKSSDQ